MIRIFLPSSLSLQPTPPSQLPLLETNPITPSQLPSHLISYYDRYENRECIEIKGSDTGYLRYY